jgi:hypothetical protein
LDKSEWGPNMVHGARETRKHVGSSRRSTSGGDSRVDRGEGQGQHLKRGGVRRPDSEQRCSPRVAEDDDLEEDLLAVGGGHDEGVVGVGRVKGI